MSQCPVVDTKLGKVSGRLQSKLTKGKQVYSYSSIPFAKPPVGNLRFEFPCKAEPWKGVLDGSKHSSRPYQDNSYMEKLGSFMPFEKGEKVDAENMSEDCLYLTVYTTNPSVGADLPVLFWIYGGGFFMGSQCFYNANVLCGLNDVIVVIPNYRVNVLGFLSLGKDTEYSGNMGLHDQILALKWTRDNIRAFGGNPDNVTIFGESAGSMSVNYHMFSPLSRDLFHRAISHSGTGCMKGLPSEDLSDTLKAFLEALEIKEEDPKKIMKKLKELPVEKINEVQGNLVKQMKYFTAYIDGKFLPEDPQKLHDEGKLRSVPYIVGCNNTENSGLMTISLPGFGDGVTKDNCKQTIKAHISPQFKTELTDADVDKILEKYEKDVKDDDKYKWSKLAGAVMGDAFFVFPTMRVANAQAKHNKPTYLYQMTQTPKCHHDLKYGTPKMMKNSFCECDHGDDIIFTFGLPLIEGELIPNAKFTEDEKKLSTEWMKYLTNFAKNGDPNVGVPVQVKWPLYSLDKQSYLSVQHPCSLGKKLVGDRLELWNEIADSKSK